MAQQTFGMWIEAPGNRKWTIDGDTVGLDESWQPAVGDESATPVIETLPLHLFGLAATQRASLRELVLLLEQAWHYTQQQVAGMAEGDAIWLYYRAPGSPHLLRRQIRRWVPSGLLPQDWTDSAATGDRLVTISFETDRYWQHWGDRYLNLYRYGTFDGRVPADWITYAMTTTLQTSTMPPRNRVVRYVRHSLQPPSTDMGAFLPSTVGVSADDVVLVRFQYRASGIASASTFLRHTDGTQKSGQAVIQLTGDVTEWKTMIVRVKATVGGAWRVFIRLDARAGASTATFDYTQVGVVVEKPDDPMFTTFPLNTALDDHPIVGRWYPHINDTTDVTASNIPNGSIAAFSFGDAPEAAPTDGLGLLRVKVDAMTSSPSGGGRMPSGFLILTPTAGGIKIVDFKDGDGGTSTADTAAYEGQYMHHVRDSVLTSVVSLRGYTLSPGTYAVFARVRQASATGTATLVVQATKTGAIIASTAPVAIPPYVSWGEVPRNRIVALGTMSLGIKATRIDAIATLEVSGQPFGIDNLYLVPLVRGTSILSFPRQPFTTVANQRVSYVVDSILYGEKQPAVTLNYPGIPDPVIASVDYRGDARLQSYGQDMVAVWLAAGVGENVDDTLRATNGGNVVITDWVLKRMMLYAEPF